MAAAVADGREKLDEFAGLTRKRVIDGLLAEAEFRGEGASAAARVAAWGHLAKIRGMFTERHEHNLGTVGPDWSFLLRKAADDAA